MRSSDVPKLLSYMQAVWPNFAVPEASQLEVTCQAWSDLLGEFRLEDVVATVRQMAASGREFAPNPGQLRYELIRPAVPDADEIIAELNRLVLDRGWPSPPSPDDCSHPAVWEALQTLGGWMSFCEGDERVNRAHLLKVCPIIHDRHVRIALSDPNVAIALENRRRELDRGED